LAHSRGLTRPRMGGKRRATAWELGPGGTSGQSLTGSAAIILGSGVAPTVEELTVVRTRGIFDITLETAASVGLGYFGAIGIGVVTSAAFAIGVTAVPTPITEQSWDGWLYHSFFSVHRGLDAGAGASQSMRLEVDSKAMRKLNVNETVMVVLEAVEIPTATAEVFFDSRMLVKLS